MEKGYESLKLISGIGISMADMLFEKGFYSAEELASAEIEDLVQIRGIGEEKAKQLIINARDYLETQAVKKEAAAQSNEEATAPPETEQQTEDGLNTQSPETADLEDADADIDAASEADDTSAIDNPPEDERESL